jgi:hypothetical protein
LDAVPDVAALSSQPGVVVAYRGAAGTLLVAPLELSARSASGSSSSAKTTTGGDMVVSVSLFIFPGRANGRQAEHGSDAAVQAYLDRVDSYMRGVERCLAKLAAHPPWVYRVYVDYSVMREYPRDSGAAAAAAVVQNGLGEVAKRWPRRLLQFRAVRFLGGEALRSGDIEGEGETTFLPSVWRYLPMSDPTVAVFCSADADNPVSSLMLRQGEAWMADASREGTRAMFLIPNRSASPQCALYVATHLPDDLQADARVACPIAQFWFWRRMRPDAADGAATFARLMDLAADAEVHAFFADLDVDWVNSDLHRAVVADPQFASLGSGQPEHPKQPGKVLDVVTGILRRALGGRMSAGKSKSSTTMAHGAHRRWATLVLGNPRLLELAALLVCGRIIGNATGAELKRLLQSNFASSAGALKAMSDVVLKQAYGVDEWLLHVVLRAEDPSTVRIVGNDTPAAGIATKPRMLSMQEGAPPFVAWLHDAAVVECADTDRAYGRDNIAEYAVRVGAMLLMLRPAEGSSPDAQRRWAAWRDELCGRTARLAGLPHVASMLRAELLGAPQGRAYLGGCMRQFFDVDVAQLDAWLKARGAAVDGHGRGTKVKNAAGLRIRYRSAAAVDALADVLTRAMFIDMRMLHIERCAQAQSAAR